MLTGIGQPRAARSADWTVLTLERDDEDPLFDVLPDDAPFESPRRGRIAGRPSLTVVEDDRASVAAVQAAREARALGGSEPVRPHELHAEDDPYAIEPPQVAANGRRTVVIRGRGAERPMALPATNQRRRPARRPSERVGHRPDRVAMYAVGLGFLLILVALLSAGGS
jgi:hypothetical protein